MATKEEIEFEKVYKSLTGSTASYGMGEKDRLRAAFLAGRESAIPEIIELINRYWSFDESQQHTHSWHDKQDLLEILYKMAGGIK